MEVGDRILDSHGASLERGRHFVQFYSDDAELARTVAHHLATALRDGGVALAIATPRHLRGFEAELSAVGVDVPAEARRGRLALLDAAETLARFCDERGTDRAAFREAIGELLGRAAGRGAPVHVFGEMVALLWDRGRVPAAIELEELWNELAEETAFNLMCAYASRSLAGGEGAAAVREVCRLHTAVLDDPGAVVDGEPPALELSSELDARADAPHRARELLDDALRRRGGAGRLRADAQLVLSELVTNAVIHARTPVSVTVSLGADGVRLAVRDFRPRLPVDDERGPNTGLGLGLRLVGSLAAAWGIEPVPDGKVIWARLDA